ncbi:MAG: undecaprenyl-phosphate glucose phosphotransferase [Clostridia bacterium]|nr:undecaprenyl-phosphate glucose phosphotransferase [Clostridia bacterium]
MHNQQKGIFDVLEGYFDMLINLVSVLMAYFFSVIVFGKTTIPIANPRPMLFVASVSLSSYLIYHLSNLYAPQRYRTTSTQWLRVVKANLALYGAVELFIAMVTSGDSRPFFLLWTLFAAIISTAMIMFKCRAMRSLVGSLRKKQYDLRRIIVVGDNAASAAEYVKQVTENNSMYGAMVIGYVGDKITDDIGVDKLGPFSRLGDILDRYKPSDVVFAIDAYDKRRLIKLVNMCDDRCIKVYFLPVIYGFFKNMRQIEQVGNIPLINAHRNPLDSRANAAMKRALDIVGSLFLIVLTSPLMLVAAVGIKLTSPGPILFKQIRIGKMGKRFKMLKFRSMRVENNSTKEWTTDKDERKTRFGNFIRKTSIDELPQLFNVLTGHMSLVGPRPEIPVFVDYFKEIIPLYMVKHYVKPGLTGYAQIKGLRGDTSIEERIHADIAYIENWSIWLDISILLKTPLKAINRNERYVSEEFAGDRLDDETTRSH